MNYKVSVSTFIMILCIIIIFPSTSWAFGLKRDGFLQEGERVLLGRGDSLFEICNRTKKTLRIALVYKHYWKFGKPPSWPAKGWFEYSPGKCVDVAVNNLFGVMSVVEVAKNGKLIPFYQTKNEKSLDEVVVYNNEVRKFKTEYFCIGKPPFKGSKKNISDYFKCSKNQEKIPFNIIFNHGSGESFTLNLW